MKSSGIFAPFIFSLLVVCSLVQADVPLRGNEMLASIPDSAPAASTQSSAVLTMPDEYRSLAHILAQPLFSRSKNAAVPSKATSELIAALESESMDLHRIHSADPDIDDVAALSADSLISLTKKFEMLSSDERSMPLVNNPSPEGLFTLIDAASGSWGEAIKRLLIMEIEKQKRSAALLQPIKQDLARLSVDMDRFHASSLLLPKVAKKYAMPLIKDDSSIEVHYAKAWGPLGPNDYLFLVNHGRELTNCTIAARLQGTTEQINVHFISRWVPNETIIAQYSPGFILLGQTFGKYTVDQVRDVSIEILSAQFSTVIHHDLTRAEQDEVITGVCKPLNLTGALIQIKNLLSPPTGELTLVLNGISYIPSGNLMVEVHHGNLSKTLHFETKEWNVGTAKKFPLPFSPDAVIVELSFPGSDYRYTRKYRSEN